MDSSVTGRTSLIGASTARNKFKTSRTLADAGVPMPTGQVVAHLNHAERTATNLGWRVVVEPLNRDQGSGVVAGIRDMATLRRAFEAAAELSPGNVITERHIDGDDHRLLIVGGRMLAAARGTPGGVTGDGVTTVAHLIDRRQRRPAARPVRATR
jgi:cyanophycin synthetase